MLPRICYASVLLLSYLTIQSNIGSVRSVSLNNGTPAHQPHLRLNFSEIDRDLLAKVIQHQLSPPKYDTILGFELAPKFSIPLRLAIFAYICLVIGYLCDEFFVPSLELIGKQLKWSNDLVGSILIPFGTSGPEIFSSAIGVFFASNEIGTGAIIGSAVFNVLAIPAVCSLVAVNLLGHATPLDKRPILRDLLFYVVSLICLTQAIRDSRIDIIDSLSLLLVFIIYLTYMFYRSKFSQEERQKLKSQADCNMNGCTSISIDDIASQTSDTINGQGRHHNGNDGTEDDEDLDEGVANTSSRHPSTSTLNDFVEEFLNRIEPPKSGSFDKIGYDPLENEDNNGFDMTQNIFLHIILFPFIVLFNLTMLFREWAFSNFLFSIVWLSILSYITVWSISGLSVQLSIPPNIAGMTILAAGSAVPDLVTGIVVIKKTKTISMSICAAIASNVFAILLGLGLPWTTQIIINMSINSRLADPTASPWIVIESGSLPTSCILLLLTVVLFYFTLRFCDWKISYRFTVLCSIIFVLFIGTNIFLEFSAYKTMLNF